MRFPWPFRRAATVVVPHPGPVDDDTLTRDAVRIACREWESRRDQEAQVSRIYQHNQEELAQAMRRLSPSDVRAAVAAVTGVFVNMYGDGPLAGVAHQAAWLSVATIDALRNEGRFDSSLTALLGPSETRPE